MGTQVRLSAPARLAAGLAVLLTAACGPGAQNTASHSPLSSSTPASSAAAATPSATAGPSAQPSPTTPPRPLTGAYGVLYDDSAQTAYTVSIVGVDGKIAASAAAAIVSRPTCAGAAGAPVPLPLSTSDTRLYFMDSDGIVRFLAPDGETGTSTKLPRATGSHATDFAVSPDDRRIAVVMADYTATGATTRLYVEDLNGGGNHVDLFSETGARTLWPVGWHGTNNLVLAVVPSCTQGGGPFCCGPSELHVVDPATANRRFTIGSSSSCVIVGPASRAGAVCENSTFTTAQELNWTAGVIGSFPIIGPSPAFISPDGTYVAVVNTASGVTSIRVATDMQMQACEWIDSTHILAGGDAQQQPRIGDVTKSSIVAVAARGQCGGRLPGGL